MERQRVRIALSYHSFGRLLLYPWGHQRALTPHHAVFSTLADSMVRYNGYRAGNPYFGTIYLTNGEFNDWAYGELTVAKPEPTFSFTPELNNQSEGGFWPPESVIAPTCEAMRYTNLFAMAVADSLEAPLPPPQPQLVAVQSAADGRRIHLSWSHPVDPMNPVEHYEVFEIDTNADPFDVAPVRLAANGRALLAHDLPRPAGGELVLRLQAELEPLWDYAYVEVRPPGGAWRPLAGEATRDASPTGRNAGRGVTGPVLDRALRFQLDRDCGPRFDLALRLDADPRSPRAAAVEARLDVPRTWTERRRVLDPDVRGTSYEVVAEKSGIFGYGVTAVDVQGQQRDSEIYFFYIPSVDVSLHDVQFLQEGRRLACRWRQSRTSPARFDTWMRPLVAAASPAAAAAEWARGDYVRAAGPLESAAPEGGLAWEPGPGRWAVLLRGEDADGPRLWGPWVAEVRLASRLRAAVPNPFNPSTELVFDLGRAGAVRLDVLATDGRLVCGLLAARLPAGEHRARWDGRDARGHAVASGIYVARLQVGSEVSTRRLVLVR
jgi:hypothetical protein